MANGPRTITGTDDAGRDWSGEIGDNGDGTASISWESDDGLTGTETVEVNEDGTMTGVDSEGDVVPCDYDGERWEGHCPAGTYTIDDD